MLCLVLPALLNTSLTLINAHNNILKGTIIFPTIDEETEVSVLSNVAKSQRP